MSGVTRQSYTPEVKVIRLMCTGRLDMAFVLRAFQKGADGVIIGGCWPGECHYVTEGNYDALGNMHLVKKLLEYIGVSPERLRLEWISASEGMRFADVMNDFSGTLKELGPLGRGEGIDQALLKVKLEAVMKLVPFLKLVEREKLRIPAKSEEAYNEFYGSDEADRLFSELIADKLAVSQILILLEDKPLSTVEISEILSLTPSDVSRHMMNSSSRHLVRYDLKRERYALARSESAGDGQT
jgi:F420-non-reducing hydrogenase iron-sulfur subunit